MSRYEMEDPSQTFLIDCVPLYGSANNNVRQLIDERSDSSKHHDKILCFFIVLAGKTENYVSKNTSCDLHCTFVTYDGLEYLVLLMSHLCLFI